MAYAHRVTDLASSYAHGVPGLASLMFTGYRSCASLCSGSGTRNKVESGSELIQDQVHDPPFGRSGVAWSCAHNDSSLRQTAGSMKKVWPFNFGLCEDSVPKHIVLTMLAMRQSVRESKGKESNSGIWRKHRGRYLQAVMQRGT
jgi:hypothetical protein